MLIFSGKQGTQNKSKSKGKHCNETYNVEALNVNKGNQPLLSHVLVEAQTRDVIRLSRSSLFDGVYDSFGSNAPIKNTKFNLDPIKQKANAHDEEDPYGEFKSFKPKIPNIIDNHSTWKSPKNNVANEPITQKFNKTEKVKLGKKLSGLRNLSSKKTGIEKASLKTHAEKKSQKDFESTSGFASGTHSICYWL